MEQDGQRFKPNLLILMIGINDSTTGVEMLPDFRSNLETIINTDIILWRMYCSNSLA
ncbi:SGNH/GDSL hydrolase family protein [Paenibacillus psychroresistens]|uniref:SGNH/GDSL hydrolase family protein n=1 Tax=Paenibacillus psychroresistens TaxID=1778678 RepID=A0A6B8REH4_9BACL|nr:SGNH/GDSL hydrolase family protein [Paenibacillus psychroresistens]QGQ94327.1 SGNH/GDSL hydrolase family protein [Paenibacillus psychroresistens]